MILTDAGISNEEGKKPMERITWAPSTADGRQEQVKLAATGPFYITTFRKGTKWLRPELVGQRVELFDESKQTVFATATVTSVKYSTFEELSPEDYFGQTNPDISSEEMLAVMKTVYGEYDSTTGTTVVTLDGVELI